ncbi:MAG TPA: hypothetical protein VFX12_01350 [Vicinamibacterales bacterium]|nr:hypothetical protein [Vicinamibacterales bacterium]
MGTETGTMDRVAGVSWQAAIVAAARDWRAAADLRRERAALRRDTRAAFAQRLDHVTRALDLLQDEAAGSHTLARTPREGRRLRRAVDAVTQAFQPLVEHYADVAAPHPLHAGPGRPRDTFFAAGRRVIRENLVSHAELGRYVMQTIWPRLTTAERVALFGTRDRHAARTIIRDRLYLRKKTGK